MKASPLAWTASPFLAEGDLFLGTYRVLREIGRGGMGVVYEVVDELGTQHRFALKLLDPAIASNSESRRRFADEAKITANVSSNHVAKVIRTGIDNETGLSYILMELLQGTDLGGRIRPGRGLALEYALMLLRQAASVLDMLHRHGIVHRDLKPANLVVALSDDLVPILKIVDFGIAKVVAEHAPVTTACLGTVPYQAPEQMVGDRQIGPAADRYALAQVAFTLLTGQPYWLADRGDHWTAAKIFQTIKNGECIAATARVQQLNDHLKRNAERPCQLQFPADFDAWFAKATAFYPEQRFGSAREMIDELARCLEATLRSHDVDVLVTNVAVDAPVVQLDPSIRVPSKAVSVQPRTEAEFIARSSNRENELSSSMGEPLPLQSRSRAIGSWGSSSGGSISSATSSAPTAERRSVGAWAYVAAVSSLSVAGALGWLVQTPSGTTNDDVRAAADAADSGGRRTDSGRIGAPGPDSEANGDTTLAPVVGHTANSPEAIVKLPGPPRSTKSSANKQEVLPVDPPSSSQRGSRATTIPNLAVSASHEPTNDASKSQSEPQRNPASASPEPPKGPFR